VSQGCLCVRGRAAAAACCHCMPCRHWRLLCSGTRSESRAPTPHARAHACTHTRDPAAQQRARPRQRRGRQRRP
jgi:hypothetical protein